MNSETKTHSQNQEVLWRGLTMLLLTFFYGVAEIVIAATVIFQFFSALFFQRTNTRLRSLGQSLSIYAYQILCFLTFNSEHRPYPFSKWPRISPMENGRHNSTED